jgi:hypothetical protein
MKNFKKSAIMSISVLAFATAGFLAAPASSLEALSQAEQQQFLDWCTGEKRASDSVCSCTLKNVVQTIPAAALTSFISGQTSSSGFSMTNLATQAGVQTAATVAQSMATCSK